MRRAVPLLALLVAGCGGAELRGASSVAPAETRIEGSRERFVAGACKDGRGRPAVVAFEELSRIELADGRQLLLESRRGYDAILVTNRFEAGREEIFQFVSNSEDGPELLHERRFELGRARAGKLLVADEFETASRPSGFRATPSRVVLRCELLPLGGGDLDTTSRLE